ncbi:UNVERIFIED_CONTAM: hypothetical protein Cloal_4136 [Acetivibrio alkalicellulosi]
MINESYANMEEKWDTLKKRITVLEMANEKNEIENVEKNKWKSLMHAISIKDSVILHIIDSNWQRARDLVALGEKYTKIALEKRQIEVLPGVRVCQIHAKNIQYELLYFFGWLGSGTEDTKLLGKALDYIKKFADELLEKKSPKSKNACMEVVATATKAGQFLLAMEYLDKVFKRKKDIKIDKDIVFNKHEFYRYILECLIMHEELELKDLIKKEFIFFFDQLIKGNERLLTEYRLINDQIEMSYIWFKYFSNFNWNNVSPYNVIQSIRYGTNVGMFD